jgi:hypothetical protein
MGDGFEAHQVFGFAVEDGHIMTPPHRFSRHMQSDETRATNKQNSHALIIYPSPKRR